jgi:heme oxygenase
LITDLHLSGVGTLLPKEISFASDQGYRKLLERVKIPLWKTTVTNILQNEQLKSHLRIVEIRCRGSDIALSSPTGFEY